jgi:5-methylcytosine-specific restriction endonuclease McrA
MFRVAVQARMIFEPVPVLGNPVAQVIKQQHSAMYATQTGPSRGGVLRCAGDFFELFNYGIRGGESRFFTYTLCGDCFRQVAALQIDHIHHSSTLTLRVVQAK